jgi:hypothetical protein
MHRCSAKELLHDLGFVNHVISNHPRADWDFATKCIRNVVLDMQGLRIDSKTGNFVPRASRRDDAEEARIDQSIHQSFHEEREAKFNSKTYDSPLR